MSNRTLILPMFLPALLAQAPETKTPLPPVVNAEKSVAPLAAPKEIAPGVFAMPEAPAVQSERVVPPPMQRTLGELARHVVVDQPQPGDLWAGSATWKANCTPMGLTFIPFLGSTAPRNFPVAFDLRSIRVGGAACELRDGQLHRDGDRLEIDHGAARERFDLAVAGVEQSFVFERLPARGELEIVIDVRTELGAVGASDGVTFTNEFGGVSYRKLCAIDADGDRIELLPRWQDGAIVLTVPATFIERADLPLVVDPLIATVGVSTAATVLENAADLSWDETTQQWLVVWERWYSQADHDIWAQRVDAAMVSVGAPFTIDYTSAAWAMPRVANNNLADNHLVVAQVSASAGAAPFWIAGRIVGAGSSGALGGQFDIERDGMAGSYTGNKFAPDVGGDPYLVGPTYYAVVWEREYSATDHDIHLKQIDTAGNLRSITPTVVDGSGTNESTPTISRGNGPGSAPFQRWAVGYQRTYSASDEDIRGALFTWDGQPILVAGSYHFSIDYSGRNHVTPSFSSPCIDATGNRVAMCVYTWSVPAQSIADLDAAMIDIDGNVLGSRYGLELGAAANRQFLPSVDGDGCRFTVAFAQYPLPNGNPDVFASTFDWDPANAAILAVEDHVALGTSSRAEWWPQVASTWASSGVRSQRLGIAHESAANPSFWVVAQSFDALRAGGIVTRTTGCGGLGITVAGIPAIGMRIGIQQTGLAPLRGFLIGVATNQPIGPCPGCRIGVSGNSELIGQLSISIPCLPALVGGTASVQAFEFATGPCLGQLRLSNTIDITVQ